jgi:hypothetical protein
MRSDSIKNPGGEERIVRVAMRARYARLRRAASETLRVSSYLEFGVVMKRHSGGVRTVRTHSMAVTMADVLSLFPLMTVGGK